MVVAEAGLVGDEVHRGKLLEVAEHLADGFATALTKAKAVHCSEINWHRRLDAHALRKSRRNAGSGIRLTKAKAIVVPIRRIEGL